VRKSLVLAPAVLLTFALAGLSPAFAQDEVSPDSLPNSLNDSLNVPVLLSEAQPAALPAFPAAASAPALPAAAPAEPGSSPRVGIGVTVGTLGVGGQVAVRVLRPLNIRAGFSGLGIGYNFNNDGIDYGAHLRLEGAPVTVDYFFFHGIHVSGGGLIYNGTRITGTAAVSSGTTFTLNNVTYESSTTAPVAGTVGANFRKAAPMVGFGFGNLVPRGSRHWSITSDFGVAFTGSPNAALNLAGLACPAGTTSGPNCLNVATNASVQANVVAEQANLNNKLRFFKIYPVLSLGFGYAF
jgi:hypothetical protein